jgi:hypothetical protein
VRAHEERKFSEALQPSEKQFRLLREGILSLARWRRQCNQLPGFEEMRRHAGIPRSAMYQRAVDRVSDLLTSLAPEVVQDLNQPVRGTLSNIEATGIIDRSAPRR